jgi:CheY-like chemotaxis protein
MSKGRVLVVEDNRDNMTLIVDVLETLNYAVIQAGDGVRGVETALAEKPDLILMDLSLPKMDGWTAAQAIKSNPEIKHIPVLALTAHAMEGDRDRALAAGCDDYLTKPINLSELAIKLNKYMDKGN